MRDRPTRSDGHTLAAGAALVVSILATSQERADGRWGIAPTAIDLVVGLLSFVVFRAKPADGSAQGKRAVDRLADAVAKLDADARDPAVADLRAAIDELAAAGHITEAVAADARETPSGLIGARFARSA